MTLHEFIDHQYGPDGDLRLKERLAEGANPEEKAGPHGETALHVAARRRRLGAVEILIAYGVALDSRNKAGKTAYAHASRRGFQEIVACLTEAGCDPSLNQADLFAIAVAENRLEEAKLILAKVPGVIKTGNPEEDRLLADIAGREALTAVTFLVENGADLTAPGLDDGLPLHIAAWFGQPRQVNLLVKAGAPRGVLDGVHGSTPLGWAVHGSRHSGGAAERQARYVEIVQILLEAGIPNLDQNKLASDPYYQHLVQEASPQVKQVLEDFAKKKGAS